LASKLDNKFPPNARSKSTSKWSDLACDFDSMIG
jgi:hypothetical protein